MSFDEDTKLIHVFLDCEDAYICHSSLSETQEMCNNTFYLVLLLWDGFLKD